MFGIRNWGRTQWLIAICAIVSSVLVITLFLELGRVCGRVVEKYMPESTERMLPAECKRRCESAGAATWTISDGDCSCSGKVGE